MKKTILSLVCIMGSFALMQAQTVQLPNAYYTATTVAVQDVVEGRTVNTEFDLNVTIPFTGTFGSESRPEAATLLFDNGPHFNIAGTPNISQLQDATLGMSTYGSACHPGGPYSMADDFVLADDSDIEYMDFYGYQTGSQPPTIDAVYVQIWDGDPSGSGTVIWGDMTTNIFDSAASADVLRQLESSGDGSRPLQLVSANTTGLSLDAGTYWVEFMFDGTGNSGPWAPPIAILGETTTGNALQQNAGDWIPVIDQGPQGMPFQIYGTVSLGVTDNDLAGFNYYPNPVSEVMNISAAKNISEVSVFNLLGQKVMTSTIEANSSELNLSSLTPGTYVLKVMIDGQTGNYKFLKN